MVYRHKLNWIGSLAPLLSKKRRSLFWLSNDLHTSPPPVFLADASGVSRRRWRHNRHFRLAAFTLWGAIRHPITRCVCPRSFLTFGCTIRCLSTINTHYLSVSHPPAPSKCGLMSPSTHVCLYRGILEQ